ncbi:competence protein ComEA [Acinetobacter calcoaceticus]|uniref:Competence protein ComEA n=1 Tax=Acinetobacter calcoaceticus TaxID=471 RepID=A0A4R1XR37_ACICA|nr:competence protein ComEA [Acinetobacter calcoaceticus]
MDRSNIKLYSITDSPRIHLGLMLLQRLILMLMLLPQSGVAADTAQNHATAMRFDQDYEHWKRMQQAHDQRLMANAQVATGAVASNNSNSNTAISNSVALNSATSNSAALNSATSNSVATNSATTTTASTSPVVALSAVQVNLNTANLEQLQKLKGIGAKKAQAILDYRQQHGPFKQIDDLKNVKGIGEVLFEKNRAQLGV